MSDIADGIALLVEAEWQQGMRDEQEGRLDEAWAHFRRAHDLVVDCPRLHQVAHRHLLRLNRQRRAWRELMTDVLLLGLAPLSIFEVLAYMMKRQVLGGAICARNSHGHMFRAKRFD